MMPVFFVVAKYNVIPLFFAFDNFNLMPVFLAQTQVYKQVWNADFEGSIHLEDWHF